MLQSDWLMANGYATRYLFVNIYRVAARYRDRALFFEEKNNAYSLFFEIIVKK